MRSSRKQAKSRRQKSKGPSVAEPISSYEGRKSKTGKFESYTFDQWKEEQLKDPEFRKAYEGSTGDPIFDVAFEVMRLRTRANLTQAELAAKVGTTQQVIARIESLRYKSHNLSTLQRVAEALNKTLDIRFVDP